MATQIKPYLKRFESRFATVSSLSQMIPGDNLVSLEMIAKQIARHFSLISKKEASLIEAILNGSEFKLNFPVDRENNSLSTLLLQVTKATAINTARDFDSALLLFSLLQEASQSYIKNRKAYSVETNIGLLEPFASLEKAKALIKNNLISYLVKRDTGNSVQEAENGRQFLVELVPFILKVIADQAEHLSGIQAKLHKLNQIKKSKKNLSLSSFITEQGMQIKQIQTQLDSIVLPENLISHLPELFYKLRYMGLSNSAHFYIDQIHRLYYQHAYALESLSALKREVSVNSDHVNVPQRIDQFMGYFLHQVNVNIDSLVKDRDVLMRLIAAGQEQKVDVSIPFAPAPHPLAPISKLFKRVDWLLPKIPRFLLRIVFAFYSVFNKVFSRLVDVLRPQKIAENNVDAPVVIPSASDRIEMAMPPEQDDVNRVQDQIKDLTAIQGLIIKIKQGLQAFDQRSLKEKKITQGEINQLLEGLQMTSQAGVEPGALNQLHKINQQLQSGLSFTQIKLSPDDRHYINALVDKIKVAEAPLDPLPLLAPAALGSSAIFKFEFERIFKNFFEMAIVANGDLLQLNMDENNAQKALGLIGKVVGQMPFGAALLEILVNEASAQVKAMRMEKFKHALAEIAIHIQRDDIDKIVKEVSMDILNEYQSEIVSLSSDDAKKAALFFLTRFQNKIYNLASSERYIETIVYDSVRVQGWTEKLKNQLMRYMPDNNESHSIGIIDKHIITAYQANKDSKDDSFVRVGQSVMPLNRLFAFKKWNEEALCKEISLIFCNEKNEHKANESAYINYIKQILVNKSEAPWVQNLSSDFHLEMNLGYTPDGSLSDLTSKIVRIRNHLASALKRTLRNQSVYQEFYTRYQLLLEAPKVVESKSEVHTLEKEELALWDTLKTQGMLPNLLGVISLENPQSLKVMSADKKLISFQKNQLKKLKKLLEHESILCALDRKLIQLLKIRIPSLDVAYLSICLKPTKSELERIDKVSRRNQLAKAFEHIVAVCQQSLASKPSPALVTPSISSSSRHFFTPGSRSKDISQMSTVTTHDLESTPTSRSVPSISGSI